MSAVVAIRLLNKSDILPMQLFAAAKPVTRGLSDPSRPFWGQDVRRSPLVNPAADEYSGTRTTGCLLRLTRAALMCPRSSTDALPRHSVVSAALQRTLGGQMSEPRPAREESRLEEHKVYALLAIPIFLVTIFIIGLLTLFGTSPRP